MTSLLVFQQRNGNGQSYNPSLAQYDDQGHVLTLSGPRNALSKILVSQDITIHADFERGSMGNMRFVSADRVVGHTRHWHKADGVGDQYYWFYFQVDGAKSRELTFELQGLIGVYRGRPHELYTKNTQPVVTYNGETWKRIQQTSYDTQSHRFTFTHLFRTNWARIAFAHPYPPSRTIKLLNRLAKHPRATITLLANSHRGQPVQLVSFADPLKPSRRQVLILTGQHPGEDAGPFFVEGMLEFLCSDDPTVVELLQRVSFHVAPMMNPDGFSMGTSRYNSAMEDLNSEWDDNGDDEANYPVEPEVQGLKNWIDAEYKAGQRLSMLVDVHNYGQRQFRHTMQAPDNKLRPFCENYLAKYWPVFVKDKKKPGTAKWYGYHKYGIPGGTLELTQSRLGDGPYLTIADYKRQGADFARAVGDYFE